MRAESVTYLKKGEIAGELGRYLQLRAQSEDSIRDFNCNILQLVPVSGA